MYKVAAYITAYQDISAIEKCLSRLYEQTYPIEQIFIVDNSPKQLVSPIFNSEKIVIDFHPENVGIAEGINIAIQWAIANQYNFLWTFDQDSEPLSKALEMLVSYYEKLNNNDTPIGIIAPLSIDIQSNQELEGAIFSKYQFIPSSIYKNRDLRGFYQKDFYECDIVITSGSLVNLQAAKNVELPNKNLFIDAVDWDYCMKFRSKGYRIFVITQALMYHNFGNFQKDHLNNNNTLIPVYTYSPLRYYYVCRNHTFIETRLAYGSQSLHLSIFFRLKSLIRRIVKIFLYESDQKLIKIWACVKGTLDGFVGKLGKTWH